MFSLTSIFILVMTLASVALQALNHWFLSAGKLEKSYPLIIAVNLCCIVLEGFLALRDPTQWAMILFLPLYVWAIVMAVRGRKRLATKKE